MRGRHGQFGRTLVLSIAAMLLAFATQGCDRESAAAPTVTRPSGPPVRSVRAAPVVQQVLEQTEAFTGEVLSLRVVDVAPLAAGRLETLSVDVGDVVVAGTEIARLDGAQQTRRQRELGAQQDSARARLEVAQASLSQHEQEISRRRALVERGALQAAELDRLQDQTEGLTASVALARAQIGEVRAQVDTARVEVDRRTVVAPVSGTVVTRHVSAGAMVSAQTPLVTIVEDASLRLIARVSERRLGRVRVGMRATVRLDAAIEEVLDARVTRVGSIVDREARTVDVEMEVTPGAVPLRHGMFARGELVLDQTDALPTVPVGALQTDRDGGTFVWSVQDGRAVRTAVTVALQTQESIALQGVTLGTEVILLPPQGLQDGDAVLVVSDRLPGADAGVTP